MYRNYLFLTALCFIYAMSFGCSSSTTSPVAPSAPYIEDLSQLPVSDVSDSDRTLWGIYTATFDIESLSATIEPDRNSTVHYNVTPWLPSPGIVVNGYDPVTGIVDVDFTISNPYAIDGYDIRLIIYTDAVGHRLINADDWTGLYNRAGGLPINPFKAFAKTEDMRRFAAHGNHTENLLISLPGGNTSVSFAVDVSYPGNCNEPYAIADFTQGYLKDESGATAHLTVDVQDWQDDVNYVNLFCPAITSVTLLGFSYNPSEEYWETIITNNTGAPTGEYAGYMIANSANSGSLVLYDEVIITVSPGDAPVNPIIAGGIYMLSTCLDVAVQGDYAYAVDWDGGLKVIDISNPMVPLIVGAFETDSYAIGVAVSGNYAFVADMWDGLHIINVSVPQHPVEMGRADTNGNAKAVDVQGVYAYVADGMGGLAVVDCSNPAEPEITGVAPTDDDAKGVVVSGNYAYVADRDGGLKVVNVSNPNAPFIEGEVDSTDGFAAGIAISGDYVYVGFSLGGLKVVDVSTPSSPVIIGEVPIDGNVYGVKVKGDFAFLANTYRGMTVVDISVPTNPIEIGNVPTGGITQDLAVSGDYAYIADDEYGMTVVYVGALKS